LFISLDFKIIGHEGDISLALIIPLKSCPKRDSLKSKAAFNNVVFWTLCKQMEEILFGKFLSSWNLLKRIAENITSVAVIWLLMK
jgi:hypothetical protein